MPISGLRRLRAFARFGRDQRGSTALEFALIALPFFTIMLALVEITLIGLAQTCLDMAVGDASRRIRVGEVSTEGLTKDEFKDDVCDDMTWLLSLDCENGLYLDVQRFDSYVDITNPDPLISGELDASAFGFDPGAASDIVLVRSYYVWDTITPFGEVFGNTSSGRRVLASTVMFRNEPF